MKVFGVLISFSMPFIVSCSLGLNHDTKLSAEETVSSQSNKSAELTPEVVMGKVSEWMQNHPLPAPNCSKELTHPSLSSQLILMGERDQSVRPSDGSLLENWEAVDIQNSDELSAIINEFGWPDLCMVDPQASTAAFLILQHTNDLSLRDKGLMLYEMKLSEGLVQPTQYAYLKDRTLMDAGDAQIYGTQYSCNQSTGELELWRVMDADRVDERRAEVGLFPLEWQSVLTQANSCL